MMKDGIGKVYLFTDAINHDYESLCYSPSAVWHSQHHLRKVVPAGTPVFSLQSKTQPKNHIKKRRCKYTDLGVMFQISQNKSLDLTNSRPSGI